ncbi:hypothetical protein [Sulfurimonas sp.]|uniref:hypothetical protein n=1 Tax=Sulfurimonas sp. TaxID=2022749 RepID=UPI003563E3E0
MQNEEAIGRVQVMLGTTRIIDINGNSREVSDADSIYHGEQLCSEDEDALLQIKYEALSDTTTYNGVFNILVDDSVILDLNGHENIFRADFDLTTLSFNEEDILSSSTTLDLSNVAEISSMEVEETLEAINGSNLLSNSEELQIVYEGDHSDISGIYTSVEQITHVETTTDIQVSIDSTLLVDIPTIIDDIISES